MCVIYNKLFLSLQKLREVVDYSTFVIECPRQNLKVSYIWDGIYLSFIVFIQRRSNSLCLVKTPYPQQENNMWTTGKHLFCCKCMNYLACSIDS